MESFFHSMKAELIRGRRYSKEPELRYDLIRYINQFYDNKRLHFDIDYNSPVEYEVLAVNNYRVRFAGGRSLRKPVVFFAKGRKKGANFTPQCMRALHVSQAQRLL